MPAPTPMVLPSESMAWGRWMDQRLTDLEGAAKRRAQGEGNSSQSVASNFAKLAEQVRIMPITRSAYDYKTGFALASGWGVYASVDIPIPPGKAVGNFIGLGNAAALDTTTGGVTSSNSAIRIGGISSSGFPASKDTGASVVNNVHAPSFSLAILLTTLPPTTTAIRIELLLQPLNPAAFPAQAANFASLTGLGVFSNLE